MLSNFNTSFDLVIQHEGGYVNHPEDPGGATNLGVTQRVYDAYRRRKGQIQQSVRHITRVEARDIYHEQYWKPVNGDRLPIGIDYMVFDYAINSGVDRAARDLQRTLGTVGVDGTIGNLTLDAVAAACTEEGGEDQLIFDYCTRRLNFVKTLKTFKTFGRGWTRRIMGERDGVQITDHGVIDLATKMARADLAYPLPKLRKVEGRALEQDVATEKDPIKVGTILSTVGASGQTIVNAADQVKPHISDGPIGRIALVVFLLMLVVGVGLIGWTTYRKIRELKFVA